MKTDDIKKMGHAYVQVLDEAKKLDPVGKHNADIDNDGDTDKSDDYLIKRRKAISANIRKEEVEEVDEALVGNQHKIDANKNGKIDSHDFKLLKKTKKEEVEVKEWTVFNRILEKLSSYKVSGVGDDPHEITTKFASDEHTKGATEAEKINSKFSQGENDWVNAHGGHGGNPSGINGHDAAKFTAANAAAGVKVAPGRPGDSKIGDRTILKAKS